MAFFDRSLSKPGSDISMKSTRGEKTSTKTTFAVSDVAPATTPLPVIPYHEAVTKFLGGQVSSCSRYNGELVAQVRLHPLIETLHNAFATHRPVSLSPDIIWLTLTQGLAHHINANAEQLRNQFVQHEGKLKIIVRRDDFVKDSPENPWPEVFHEFTAAIHEHIGDTYDLIVANFSTTGPIERAASEIVLMDAMQAYFSYEVHTLCGIPSITLEGTLQDWQEIAERVRAFRRLGLDWWVDSLEPLLNQFVDAASGTVDRRFWDSIYKWHGQNGSGREPFLSGWILNLFPYLTPLSDSFPVQPKSAVTFCRNPWINGQPSVGDGPPPDRIPRLPARAPFVWKYFGTDYRMEFIGGLIGIQQDAKTLCLRPEIGWAVWETGAEQRKRKAETEVAERNREAVAQAAQAAQEANARKNEVANRRFAEVRKLGLQIHQLYLAARSADVSSSSLDKTKLNQWLLDLAVRTYQTDSEFQQSWDTVYSEPPTQSHTKWLSLWISISTQMQATKRQVDEQQPS